MDIDTFCSRCVDPMGEESDHVQMVALTDILQIPVRVVYLDRTTNASGTQNDIADDANRNNAAATAQDSTPDVGPQQCASYASAVDGNISAAGTVGSGIGDGLAIGWRNCGGAAIRVDVHDFIPEGLQPHEKSWICLLYRPGHYDILYQK